MTEKPILFSTEMVQAILDGRKKQTRRAIKPQPIWIDGSGIPFKTADADPKGIIKCPYPVGTKLWVRETWYKNYPHKYGRYWYRADGEEIDMPTITGGTMLYGKADGLKWRPSIYMPKEAARIRLEVTEVRVERLQEMDRTAPFLEGCPKEIGGVNGNIEQAYLWFRELWDSLNASRGYPFDSNCWVWAITFKRVEAI